MFPYSQTPQGYRLCIRVTPKASKNRLGELYTAADTSISLKIYVTAPAEDNKANEAVIILLAKTLGIAKSSLSLESGHKDRQKVVLIPLTAPIDRLMPYTSMQESLF